MASVLGFVHRVRRMNNPPAAVKNADPLQFGILGAANVGPRALLIPASTHPDVVVQVVAARDQAKARQYAQTHGIPGVKASYQDILDDPEIDCVYIPLPNGLHYEWTLRAIKAGKHVLLEKPSASNSTEAEALFSQPNPPILLEAMHSMFHPAWAAFLSYLSPGEVVYARSCVWTPWGVLGSDDIRYNYDLGGGALADMGPYTMGAIRMIFGTMPISCEECVVKVHADKIDENFKASFRFPDGGLGVVEGDLQSSWTKLSPDAEATMRPIVIDASEAGVKIHEGQEVVRTRNVFFKNFALATAYHRIQVNDEYVIRKVGDADDGSVVKNWKTSKTVKAYTFKEAGIEQPGEAYHTTYRYMLDQFVNKVRGKERPQGMWIDAQFSIDVAKMIDMAYSAAGMSLRPTSKYTP
ncbi:NAD(P)-binding protein [Whalleya microplaca]|nr:NAD(P)-binding protein [Whalleya microplaca]